MKKIIIFRILISIGIINSLIIVFSALTGTNSYTIANNLEKYYKIVLCYIPLILICIAVIWYFVDQYFKIEKRVNYFALAFTAILSDALFIIGTILFATGH